MMASALALALAAASPAFAAGAGSGGGSGASNPAVTTGPSGSSAAVPGPQGYAANPATYPSQNSATSGSAPQAPNATTEQPAVNGPAGGGGGAGAGQK
jgi:hypothetical protein